MKKIIINSGALISAMEETKKVIERTAVIPIAENWLFIVKDGRAEVVATDLQTTLVKVIGGIDGSKDFECTLPPPVLAMIKKFDEGPLVMEYDEETYSVIFSSDTDRTKFAGDNPEDFPSIKTEDADEVFTDTSALFGGFDELLQYVSKDELRPAMSALNFGYHKGKFNITATDGHTLAVVNVPGLNEKGRGKKEIETLFNLPAKTAKILYGYRPKKTDPFELIVWRANKDADGNFKNVVFQFGDMTVIARNIDEKYPEYPQVMPTKHKTVYTGVKEDFLKQLDKAMICANKTTHQVRLSLNGKLSLSAEDLDFSNEFNGIVQGSYEGEPLEIGFNGKFLARVIEGAPKEFALYMNEPGHAAVLKGENKTILVMPVMLNQYS